jgi:hypothetical protein
MNPSFAIYLCFLGFAALVAIAWPGAVMIGFFLGVIPGVVLWVAPSLFMYSLLWWCTRAFFLVSAWIINIHVRRSVVSVLSAMIVAIPAAVVPQLINMQTEAAVQRLRADDKELERPIALPSTVALVIDGNYDWKKRKPSCEVLCLRLLYNETVARVIAIDSTRANDISAFWIEQRVTCPERPNFAFDVAWKTDFPLVRGDNLRDRVRARIVGGDCLLEGDGRPEDATLTISYRKFQKGRSALEHSWDIRPGLPAANRLEIIDANDGTIYRRTEVKFARLATPLLITTRAGLLTTVTYAGWWRSEETLGQMGPNGRDVFPQILGEAVRKPEANSDGNFPR